VIYPMLLGKRHASEIASLALDLREGLRTFKIPHLPEEQLKLRIGLHTGIRSDNVLSLFFDRM
jgi:Adenylate and Guanylate cyclase catalytic domain